MNSKTLTLAGAVVLIIGLFLPVLSVFGISVNMIMPGGQLSVDGLVLAACAILAAVLALIGQGKWAVIPGLVAVGFLVYDYMKASSALAGQASADVPPEAAEALSQMASLNYLGWGVMGLGGVLILLGGAMGWKSSAPAA